MTHELAQVAAERPSSRGEVAAQYCTSGDKYRLTLINASWVENWFDPAEAPRARKGKSILLVPSRWQCKLSDMDLESGTWL